MKKYGNEFKVGLFFILCLLGGFYLVYSTGKLDIKKDGYNVNVVFDEIAGLDKKAPVMLNGLEVGKVVDINARYTGDKTEMVLKLWLKRQAKIRKNPVISIKTLGLMGEKYIQISSSGGKGFVKPGETLSGQPYIDMDELIAKADSISEDIQGLIKNVNGLTDEVKKLAVNLNYTVEDNQDRITEIIKSLDTASNNMVLFSEDIKLHPWKLIFRTNNKKIR